MEILLKIGIDVVFFASKMHNWLTRNLFDTFLPRCEDMRYDLQVSTCNEA